MGVFFLSTSLFFLFFNLIFLIFRRCFFSSSDILSTNFLAAIVPNLVEYAAAWTLSNSISQITISSHTHKHRILNKISEVEIEIELETSKKLLESLINTQINSLCFPEGKFNKKAIDIARKIGYQDLYISIPGFYFDQFSIGVIKRSLVQFASKREFKAILKGGDHILSKWYQIKHYN